MSNYYKNLITVPRILAGGCFAGAIWFYGRKQYYQGRIDQSSEITEDLKKIVDEFEQTKMEIQKRMRKLRLSSFSLLAGSTHPIMKEMYAK